MDVLEAIHTRRTTKRYRPDAPPRELVEQVLEAAVWAPNHHLTQPWEFVVLSGPALEAAADFRARATEASLNGASESIKRSKGEEARRKVLAAPLSVVVALRQTDDPIGREEDYAAGSAAIQNMLLAAKGLGLSAFWGTGLLVADEPFRRFLGLSPEQRIIGIVQLGYGAEERVQRRAPAASKTRWLSAVENA